MTDKKDIPAVAYEESMLKLLTFKKPKIEELPKILSVDEDKIIEILKYLKGLGAVTYVTTMGKGFEGILDLEVTPVGQAAAMGRASLHTNTTSNQNFSFEGYVVNFAQSTGDNNVITQTANISMSEILKEMINKDSELNTEEKGKLSKIIDKFKTVTQTTESVVNLINEIKEISAKYAPYVYAALPYLFKITGN